MDLLMRRREMMLAAAGGGTGTGWDYTLGLPAENGWTKEVSSSYFKDSLGESYVSLSGNSSSGYIRYIWPEYNPVCSFEAEISFINNTNFQMYLSDGVDKVIRIRAQYSQNYKGIYLYTGTTLATMTKLQSISTATFYKIKLALDGEVGYVYVDDVLVADSVDLSTIVSTTYATGLQYAPSANLTVAGKLRSMSLKLGMI